MSKEEFLEILSRQQRSCLTINHEAAESTAVICSLLASCKTSQVNPKE